MENMSKGELIDLNDCAVNHVREYCRAVGYNPVELIAEETQRMIDQSVVTMQEYLKCTRIGSYMRLNRKMRKHVYNVIATRKVLTA